MNTITTPVPQVVNNPGSSSSQTGKTESELGISTGQLSGLFDQYRDLINNYNQRVNNDARAWYENMAGSQYQRAVEDIKKAGLNPYWILSNGGSVAPVTSIEASSSSGLNAAQALLSLFQAVLSSKTSASNSNKSMWGNLIGKIFNLLG